MSVSHTQHVVPVLTEEGYKNLAYQLWQPSNLATNQLVICVHGLTRNSRDFDFIARELAQGARKGARVVCPDILGRGDSDWFSNAASYGYPQYVQLMWQLMLHLQHEFNAQECDWVGTSMGGLIGMMLATSEQLLPIKLRRLVLNDVGYLIPAAALNRLAQYVGKASQFNSVDEVEIYLREVAASFGSLTPEQWQHLAKHSSQASTNQAGEPVFVLKYDPAIATVFSQALVDVDLSVVWQQVSQPVLLLRGAQSDLLLPDTAKKMASQANVSLVEFEKVGHAPMLMDVEQIQTVARFLN